MLKVHREVVLVTCEENCFCWTIDKYLIRIEKETKGGNVK